MSDMFSVSSERLDDELGVVVLSGEVDIFTAPQFKECLLELLDAGVKRLVVDLSDVTFIDSTALGVLIGGVRRVHGAGGTMTIVVTTRAGRARAQRHRPRPRVLDARHARRGHRGARLTAALQRRSRLPGLRGGINSRSPVVSHVPMR